MSGCDGPRRRKSVVAKQPSAESDDNDVMVPDDDVKTSRDKCVNLMHGIWASIVSQLHQPVDASSLAVFRVLFGKYYIAYIVSQKKPKKVPLRLSSIT